jgi:hypothetical protein
MGYGTLVPHPVLQPTFFRNNTQLAFFFKILYPMQLPYKFLQIFTFKPSDLHKITPPTCSLHIFNPKNIIKSIFYRSNSSLHSQIEKKLQKFGCPLKLMSHHFEMLFGKKGSSRTSLSYLVKFL